MGDSRVTRAGWLRAVLCGVGHHGDAAARFEEVVDRLGHPLPVGPVERLSEGDEPEPAEIEIRNLLRQTIHPPGVDDPALPGVARGLGEHVGIRFQSDHLADDRGQFHGEDSGTAPDVEEASRAIQPALRCQRATDRRIR